MKIIKNPDPIECDNCRYIFEYDVKDIIQNDCQMKSGSFLGILPLSRNCTTIECPICKHKIILEWKNRFSR